MQCAMDPKVVHSINNVTNSKRWVALRGGGGHVVFGWNKKGEEEIRMGKLQRKDKEIDE